MNLQQILHKITEFAKQQKWLNEVTNGNPYDVWNGDPNLKYGVVNIDIPQISVNTNLQDMQIALFYADRLAEDNSNMYEIKKQVQNGSILYFEENSISKIKEMSDYLIKKGYDIVYLDELLSENKCKKQIIRRKSYN